jgi:predicted kinase
MPVLFVLIAKPGHGKSVIAEEISGLCDAVHIESDVVRKTEVADESPTYSSEESQKTYNLIFEKAEENLSEGRNVILDATFGRKTGRERAKGVGKSVGAKTVFIRVNCDSEVAKSRIREREGVSDANIEVYENFTMAPVENMDTVTIDNSGSLENTKGQVEEIVKKSF